jgi:TonB family protein
MKTLIAALCVVVSGAACASAGGARRGADCEQVVAQSLADARDGVPVAEAQPRKKNARRVERMMEDSVAALGLDSIPAPATLRFRVTKEGRADGVAVVSSSGSPAFDAIAVWAMQQAEFEPARLRGCPVTVWVEVPASVTIR